MNESHNIDSYNSIMIDAEFWHHIGLTKKELTSTMNLLKDKTISARSTQVPDEYIMLDLQQLESL